MPGLLGKKLGMSNVFDAVGNRIPVTMVQVGPCTVVGIRKIEKEGYNAIQLGIGEKKKKNLAKAQSKYYEANNLPMSAVVKEIRLDSASEFELGKTLDASFFNEGDIVKVRGYSKGKGFQGVMRRHNFGGVGGTTHGQSDRLRAPGSIGASSYPSRVFKGQRMAGRLGNEKVTVANLKIVKIIPEKNIILLKGAVPGTINSVLEILKK